MPLFIWGFCLSTVLLWHDTFTINFASRTSSARAATEPPIPAANNWLLALLTLGEGWQQQSSSLYGSARQASSGGKIDITYTP